MISMVVPAYNERGNMKLLVERAGEALAASGEAGPRVAVQSGNSARFAARR
jgi:hypothetical protein